MTKLILTTLLGFSSALLAQDISGIYKGGGHFGDVKITARGSNSFYLETCGAYGSICHEITAIMSATSPDNFQSSAASIVVYYGSWRCAYNVLIQLNVSGNQIYLSEFGPSNFPDRFNGCPSQQLLNFSNYIEAVPYTKQ